MRQTRCVPQVYPSLCRRWLWLFIYFLFFKSGTYTISISYISGASADYNEVDILIDNVVIGTFGNNSVNASTIFSQQFTILNNAVALLELISVSTGDSTTAIDDITITSHATIEKSPYSF